MPYSKKSVGTKVYIGDILESVTARDIEDELTHYGPLTESPWIARNPPGFAFVYFKRSRDAETAIRILDGNYFCGSKVRVELGMDQHRDNARLNDSRNTIRKRPRERERHMRPPSPRRQSNSKDSRSRSKFDRFDDRFNNNDEDDIYDSKDDHRRPVSPTYRSRSPLSHRRRSRSPQRRHDQPTKIPSLMDIPVAPLPVAPLLPDLIPTRKQRSKTSGAALRKTHTKYSGPQKGDRLSSGRQNRAKPGHSPGSDRKRSRHHSSPNPTVPPRQRRSYDREPGIDRRSPISRSYLPQASQSCKSSSKRPSSQQRGFSSRTKSPEGAKYTSKSQRVFRSLSPRSPPRDSKRKPPSVPPPLMSQIVAPIADSILSPPAPLIGNDFLARYGSPLRDHSPQSPISHSSSPDYNSRKLGNNDNHRSMTSFRSRTPPKTLSNKRSRSPYMSPPRERSSQPSSDRYSSPHRGRTSLKSKVGRYVSRSPERNQPTRSSSGRSPIKSTVHKRYKDKNKMSDIKSRSSRMADYPRGWESGRDSSSYPQKYSSHSDTMSYRREDRLTPPRSALGAVYTPAEHRSLSPLNDSHYMTYLPPPPLPPPLLPPSRPTRNKRKNKGVKSRMSMKERRDHDVRKNATSRSNIRSFESSKQLASRSIPPPSLIPSHYDKGERHSYSKTRHYTPPPLSLLPPPRSRDKPRRTAKPSSARQAVAARIKQRAIGTSRSNALRNQPRSRIRDRRR